MTTTKVTMKRTETGRHPEGGTYHYPAGSEQQVTDELAAAWVLAGIATPAAASAGPPPSAELTEDSPGGDHLHDHDDDKEG